MIVFYSDAPFPEQLPKHTLFLAGPTPRELVTPSWRPTALAILDRLGYEGGVFVPEHQVKKAHVDYVGQVEWENTGLISAKRIVFWVPRNLKTMPALTTNVEFGRFAPQSNCLYGRPDDSEKNRYLDWYYRKFNGGIIYNNLEELLKDAIV